MSRSAIQRLLPLMNQPVMRSARKTPPKADSSWFRIENHDPSAGTAAKVYIYDEIGFWGVTAQEFAKELLMIEGDAIDLHLNSPGGAMFDGIAIYNALVQHPAFVTVYIDGLAASAASFIAQAGDKIVMSIAGTVMIHDAMAVCMGNAADMNETATILDKMSNNIADIYAQQAGGTSAEWRAFMVAETWYNATEAVDSGLAHEVYGKIEDPPVADPPENKWDLSVFNYAGRKNAPSPEEVRVLITNRAREAPVGKTIVKNDGTETPAADPAGDPPGAPDSGDAGVPPPEDESPEKHEGEGQAAPVVPSVPAVTDSSGLVVLVLNGVRVNDAAAIQAHITALETFRNETLSDARKSFVAQLGHDKKILASQITALETFAASLSEEQYTSWKASWDAAPVVSALGTPVVQPPRDGQPPEASASDDETAILEGIIKNHKLSGMKPEAIKNTDSYKKLIAHVPDYQL